MVHLRLYVPNIPNYCYPNQSTSEDDYSLNSISSEHLFSTGDLMAPAMTQNLLETRLNVKYESRVLDFTYYPLTGKPMPQLNSTRQMIHNLTSLFTLANIPDDKRVKRSVDECSAGTDDCLCKKMK